MTIYERGIAAAAHKGVPLFPHVYAAQGAALVREPVVAVWTRDSRRSRGWITGKDRAALPHGNRCSIGMRSHTSSAVSSDASRFSMKRDGNGFGFVGFDSRGRPDVTTFAATVPIGRGSRGDGLQAMTTLGRTLGAWNRTDDSHGGQSSSSHAWKRAATSHGDRQHSKPGP
jgi:hypothetical protein